LARLYYKIKAFKDIEFIPVPGHSIDDHAMVLHGRTTKVLVAGDALYHRDLWRNPAIPYLNFSDDMYRRSAEHIAGFPGVIIPGHDRAYNNNTGEYMEINKFIPL
jgi:glyoxylase-like metal-dependent hydrolase (beta-lactamase superfamily II)